MKQKKSISLSMKLSVGMLAVLMIAAVIMIAPKQVNAAVVADTVIYVQDSDNYDIKQYWNADSTKRITPIKEGYVFGGWFEASTAGVEGAEQSAEGVYYAPLEESDLQTSVPDTAYAKFVPAQVLSVKAQNQANISASSSKTHVRIISSLDSSNYEKVGFDIWLANKTQLLKSDNSALETTKIYTGLKEGDNVKTVAEVFGGVSEYLSVWQLNNVGNSNFSKIIYVRPYWITMDGTKVEGLAKYVHIEDDYLGYISVPVNLLSKDEVSKVAAGAVNMTYDNASLELADTNAVSFEAGRLVPEMEFYHNTSGKTIQMSGNVATVGEYNSGECLFANIRFKKPAADTNFDMTTVQFCDWDEQVFSIDKVWDIKYEAETTSE